MLRGALKHAAVHLNHMVEETVQALWTENVHFFYNYVRNYIPGRWSLRSP